MLPLQVITVFAIATALALAHALEYTGKMLLSNENYIAAQRGRLTLEGS
jgi:hypothetical protein